MSTPKRIQLQRDQVLPAGAIRVDRPSILRNPFDRTGPILATSRYRTLMRERLTGRYAADWRLRLDKIAGHDLVCTCALDQPCHADVLLQLANHQEVARE